MIKIFLAFRFSVHAGICTEVLLYFKYFIDYQSLLIQVIKMNLQNKYDTYKYDT